MRRAVLRSLLACLATLSLGVRAVAAPAGVAAGSGARPPTADRPGECGRYGTPRPVGTVPEVLHELSGLAASRRHPGVFWAHNDSGNRLALYAVREDGTVAATFALQGAAAADPEDLAVGPCAARATRSCIYLGDLGDNGLGRAQVAILKVPEPEDLRDGSLTVESLPFRYPDGAHNAEALVVDPRTARLFLITKTLVSLGEVYRLDGLGAVGGGRAVRVRQLRRPPDFDSYTTAADAHPAGDRLLLRTYGRVWELRAPRARALEDVLAEEPVEVPGASQPQGEAAAYRSDGRGYLLGSETAGSVLYRVDCSDAEPAGR